MRHSNAFKSIKDFEREFNLDQIIKTSTRVTKKTSNCIDLIFTNIEYIQSSGTLDVSISDHLPTFLIKKKDKSKTSFSKFDGRSYVNYDINNFQYDIKTHPLWYTFWEIDDKDPGKLWDIVIKIIKEVADIHCPLKQMKFRDDSPEWITKDMVQEIFYKDHLYKKAKHTKDEKDWELFHKKKNEVKKLLSNAKEGFIKNKLVEHSNNPRRFWRTINEMSGLGKNKSKKSSCTKLVDESGTQYENQEASEYLNDYYVNVGPNLANSLDIDWDKGKCKIHATSVFNFTWIRECDVMERVLR